MTMTATYGTLPPSEHSTQLHKAVIASIIGTATVLRMLHGIGVGRGGSVLLAMEWSRHHGQRGLVASRPQFGVPCGLFLVNLAVLAFSQLSVLLAYIALMSRPLARAPLAGADVAILGLKDAVAPENKQTRTKAFDSSVAACGAVVIAILTGIGIKARGIRFVPREAVPRRVEERRR
jgi:hypothetical protein